MRKIRNVTLKDLENIINVEEQCFPPEEAATKEAFLKRIQQIPDSFFVVEEDGTVVGLVNGPVLDKVFLTDDLFKELEPNPLTGGHQSVLGLAVSPSYQKQGLAVKLLETLEREARSKERETITLTCKANLIPFYEKQGYENRGASESKHGGATWYNMVKPLK